MNKSENKFAIIGCGYWGSVVAKNLRDLVDDEIFLFDKKIQNLSFLNKKIKNSKVVKSFNEILINKYIKNIFLITPPSENLKLIKKLLNHNKNIFVEKPGLLNIKNFNEIIKINKKKNNVIMFGYVYLFNKYIDKIKKIILSNELGKILFVKSLRENLGPIRNDVDCIYDLASHDFSILKHIFSKKIKVENVIKHKILNKKNTDISTLNAYIDDINIEIRTSWLNPEKIRKLIIIGTKKMLVYNELLPNKNILIYNQYAKYPEIKKFNKIIFSKSAQIYKGSFKSIDVLNNDPLKDELKHFIKCIKLNKKPKTNILFAKEILETLNKTKSY